MPNTLQTQQIHYSVTLLGQNWKAHGSKVMSSFSEDEGKEIVHTMYVLRKVVELQDAKSLNHWSEPKHSELAEVTLVRLDYHVSKKSGDILLDSKAIRTIKVRDNPPEVLTK